MDKSLLRKYFQNCCNRDELLTVLNWFETHSDTPEAKSLVIEVWEEVNAGHPADQAASVDFDLILDRIHHQMSLDDRNTEKRSWIDSGFIRIVRNAAAVLLLPVAAVAFYFSARYSSMAERQMSGMTAYNEVFSSVDAITRVSLPDGSSVWLNHNSSLRYPATFRNDARTVELSGEGYFEIATNPDRPFVVSAGNIDIVATGTTFNVLAYPEESKIETSLLTGKVKIRETTSGSVMEMKPSEMVIYEKDEKEFLKRVISDDHYFSWKDGRLIFKDEPIDEVVRKLSRWFNVEIEVQDSELNDLTVTGTFINENLNQVMELISIGIPASYSISDRHETGQGTFSKRKVTLYKKKTNNKTMKK